MARTRRVKSMAEGTAHYHLVSRACNRQFLFRKARTKDRLAELVKKAAEFSGIELEAFARQAAETEVFPGCLPCEGLARRVAQISEGKIYGSEEFVRWWIVGLGSKFNAARVLARAVGGIGFSSHGWRIAAKAGEAVAAA